MFTIGESVGLAEWVIDLVSSISMGRMDTIRKFIAKKILNFHGFALLAINLGE